MQVFVHTQSSTKPYMVSALVSGSPSGQGSSPGRKHCVKFLGKTPKSRSFTVHVSSLVYKWEPANLMLGLSLRWTCIPCSRLDFRRSHVSGLRRPPREELQGRSAGSILEQRLVIEPNYAGDTRITSCSVITLQ